MKFPILLSTMCLGALATPTTAHDHLLQHPTRQADQTNGSYIPIKAPRDNLWAPISEKERASMEKWLDRQLNSTIKEELYWDTWQSWVLPPNKTEATAYLDGKAKKPKRYARVMASGDCYDREYMVGPLPICSKTKVVPLDYYYPRGNATRDSIGCNDEDWEEDDDLPSNRTRPAPGPDGRESRLEVSGQGQWDGTREPRSRKRDTPRLNRKRQTLERRVPENPYDETMEWNGNKLAHDDQAPPVAILPDGARHEFDPKQNYVSWMDFSFFVTTGPSGVSLHDIHWKGERVVYELAMQEALAHYAGPDEDQTRASYLDVTIGYTNFNVIPGFDCPSYATYTDAFCLFEYPKDYPLMRHQEYDYYHAAKNTAFMVRSTSTVGNYDYQTTYEFHHDGSIQVIVRASGYIQGSDYVEDDAWEYGFKIRDNLSGSMHDHVLNFKADVDIHGAKNSLFKTEFVPHSEVYPWSEGKVINHMKVERSFISSENEGRINWAPNAAASYSVVNKDTPNEFGEFPGFKIYPSLGASVHLTVQNSTTFPDEINWATHQMYALQRKDGEPVSSHPVGSWDDGPARINFDDFFNGESLDQEDIVLYFNLGMHHMPDTYDLPVTVFQGAQSGITLRPQNYGKSSNSVSTRQQIHVTNEGGKVVAERYGSKELSGSYDLTSANSPWLPQPEEAWEEGDDDWDEDEDEDGSIAVRR